MMDFKWKCKICGQPIERTSKSKYHRLCVECNKTLKRRQIKSKLN